LTSGDIGDIIINSVAIAFIMDIDNFCREAFETEAVSERANNSEFLTVHPAEEEVFTTGESKDHVKNLEEAVLTFSNVKKVFAVIVAAVVVVYSIRTTFCSGDVTIAADDVPSS
jgi:hypothetical protein